MIQDPLETWQIKLNNIFKYKEKSEVAVFLDIVGMIIHNSDKNTDMSSMYETLDFESFIKMIHLFDGRTVTFPTKEELKESIELALFFYYKNVAGVTSYKDLKKFNLKDGKELNSISMGRKLSKLSREIQEKLKDEFLKFEGQE